MRRVFLRAIVIAVVATCLACPIFQMFDHWDHGERSGKDTESTLFIVALTVGLAIPVSSLVFQASATVERKIAGANFRLDESQLAFETAPVPVSQPPPVLRI
jgi:hypothetical protein